MEQVAGLGVADVLERVRVSADAAATREEQAVSSAFQIHKSSGGCQPARAGGGNIGGIVQTLEDAVVLEVDSIRCLRKPEVRDVIIHPGAKGIGGVIVRPESVALLRHRECGAPGVVAAEDFLLVDNLQGRASGDDAKNAVRIQQTGSVEGQFG